MFKELSAPFDPSLISWRVGSTTKDKSKGMALAYVDARDVMKRLDEVVGPENWQDRYEGIGQTLICYLSIKSSSGEWITKADGAGDTAVEAEKGRISDAFKRAAVKWGVGRYLYDLKSPWVQLDEYKAIAKSEYPKLEAVLRGVNLPEEAKKNERLSNYEGVQDDMKDLGYDFKKVYETVIEELSTVTDSETLALWVKRNKETRRMNGMPDDLKADVANRHTTLKTFFQEKGV